MIWFRPGPDTDRVVAGGEDDDDVVVVDAVLFSRLPFFFPSFFASLSAYTLLGGPANAMAAASAFARWVSETHTASSVVTSTSSRWAFSKRKISATLRVSVSAVKSRDARRGLGRGGKVGNKEGFVVDDGVAGNWEEDGEEKENVWVLGARISTRAARWE